MYKRVKDSYVDDKKKRREYADIYVGDLAEARAVDTDDYIQGSKLYVVAEAALFVLQATGSIWRNAVNGAALE